MGIHRLETFMGVEQKIAPGTYPRIPHVVSKSDRDHGTATTAHRTLGLTPAGTICCSNLSLSLYPIQRMPAPIRGNISVLMPCPQATEALKAHTH